MKEVYPSKGRFVKPIIIILISLLLIIGKYTNRLVNKRIKDKLTISLVHSKYLEYGEKVNSIDLVKKSSLGTISNYPEKVDTSSVGVKKLTYEIKKRNVSKKVSFLLEVKDTKKPKILIKKEHITIKLGQNYNLSSNIISVNDEVDGLLAFTNKRLEKGKYTISSNFNNRRVGSYRVIIRAMDKNDNIEEKSYTIKVVNYSRTRVMNLSATPSNNSSATLIAKNYLGYRYRYGGNSPSTGFDCTGFVHYVYLKKGIDVGRTIYSQKNSGKRINKNSMMPGDILIWSDRRDGSPTHSAIYLGNNKMIHAANYRYNVEIRNLSTWRGRIVDVRRV